MSEIIYGRNAVLEALEAQADGGRSQVEKILILKGASGSVQKIEGKAKALGVTLQYVERQALERVLRDEISPLASLGRNDGKRGGSDATVISSGGSVSDRSREISKRSHLAAVGKHAGQPNGTGRDDIPNHQGVLAFVSEYEYRSVEDILARAAERGESPFIVILDGIEDPGNLGAIMRSAEGAGAHGIVIPKRRAASVTAAAIKASAGAAEHIFCARVSNIAQTIERLKEENIWVYACDMGGPEYFKADLKTGGIALVVGNEGSGVSRLVREKCDGVLSIPMCGKVQSLNASNAAAVLLYEVVRQRMHS